MALSGRSSVPAALLLFHNSAVFDPRVPQQLPRPLAGNPCCVRRNAATSAHRTPHGIMLHLPSLATSASFWPLDTRGGHRAPGVSLQQTGLCGEEKHSTTKPIQSIQRTRQLGGGPAWPNVRDEVDCSVRNYYSKDTMAGTADWPSPATPFYSIATCRLQKCTRCAAPRCPAERDVSLRSGLEPGNNTPDTRLAVLIPCPRLRPLALCPVYVRDACDHTTGDDAPSFLVIRPLDYTLRRRLSSDGWGNTLDAAIYSYVAHTLLSG